MVCSGQRNDRNFPQPEPRPLCASHQGTTGSIGYRQPTRGYHHHTRHSAMVGYMVDVHHLYPYRYRYGLCCDAGIQAPTATRELLEATRRFARNGTHQPTTRTRNERQPTEVLYQHSSRTTHASDVDNRSDRRPKTGDTHAPTVPWQAKSDSSERPATAATDQPSDGIPTDRDRQPYTYHQPWFNVETHFGNRYTLRRTQPQQRRADTDRHRRFVSRHVLR